MKTREYIKLYYVVVRTSQSKHNRMMSEKNGVQVVAALFWRQNPQINCVEVLIFQRAKHVSGAGFWEFPGGKIENDENHEEALIREIQEELGIRIKVGEFIAANSHDYSTKRINLSLYFVTTSQPLHFDLIDHQDYAWVTLNQIQSYPLAAADIPFLPVLKNKLR